MADIFESAPGIVAVFDNQKVIPGRIYMPEFQPVAALIAGIDLTQGVNKQFQPALDTTVYIYVFGDQIGELCVHGKAFPQMCTGGDTGISEIMDFYEANRASVKQEPIEVVAGERTITGFLTGMRIKSNTLADDPIGLITDYDLIINTLPITS